MSFRAMHLLVLPCVFGCSTLMGVEETEKL